MPYVVTRGSVEDGEAIYSVGEDLPEGVGDDAMVEAGSVEWLPERVAAALAECDLNRKSNRELRDMLEERGVEANPRLNKDDLIALLSGDTTDDDQSGEGE